MSTRAVAIIVLSTVLTGCAGGPSTSREGLRALKPVYAPLAEFLVDRFELAESDGIGIDVGGGPGDLIVELASRTPRMHWINADIDPRPFARFFRSGEAAGVSDRVSALRADACSLPFRDEVADVVVSRGSFHLWSDLEVAFAEVRRVLKPDGVAWIGRGFSENLPVETARAVRAAQRAGGGEPRYGLDETEAELRGALEAAGIRSFRIHRPNPPGAEGVNYGIWVEFRKAGIP